MKPVSGNRKIKLKFMDVTVELSGSRNRNMEGRAMGIMASLDRLKVLELMNELDHSDENSEMKHRKPKLKSSPQLAGYQ